MVTTLKVHTLLGANAYAVIQTSSVSMDVLLSGGRSVASSLQESAADLLRKAEKQTHKAALMLAASSALDASGPGATCAEVKDASIQSAGVLLARLAGFIRVYGSDSAMSSGGADLVAQADILSKLLRGE